MSDAKTAEVAESVLKVAGCATYVVAIPLHIIWSAWVTVRLWAWFAVPAFHLPPLSLAIAAGLEILVASQRGVKVSEDDGEDYLKTVAGNLGRMFLLPAFWLLIGWTIQKVAL